MMRRNSLYKILGKTGLVQCDTEGETTGYHPEDTPLHVLEIFFSYDTCSAEYSDWNHSHHIGIDSGISVEYPHEDSYSECNPYDICLGIRFSGILYLEFYLVRCEREELKKKEPCEQEHHDNVRDHDKHPLAEANALVHCLCKITEGNSVRRGSDRSTDTTEVRSYRDSQCKTCSSSRWQEVS